MATQIMTYSQSGKIEVVQGNQNAQPYVKAEFTRVYKIYGDSCNNTESNILATTGLPVIGSTVSLNGYYVVVQSIEATEGEQIYFKGNRCFEWDVTVQYSTEAGDDAGTSPTDRQGVVNWSGELVDEVLPIDLYGRKVVNAVGDRVVVETPMVIITLNISRTETFPADPKKIQFYSGSLNIKSFVGAPAGCAWMQPIAVTETIEGGRKFNKVDYEIKFKIRFKGSTFSSKTPTLADFIAGNLEYYTWTDRILSEGHRYVWFVVSEGPLIDRNADQAEKSGIWPVTVTRVLQKTEDGKNVNLVHQDGSLEDGTQPGGLVTQHGWRCNWIYPFQKEGEYLRVRRADGSMKYTTIGGVEVVPVTSHEGPFFVPVGTKRPLDWTPLSLEAVVLNG